MIEHNLKQQAARALPLYKGGAGRGWPTLPNLNFTAERQRQTRRDPSPHNNRPKGTMQL